MVRSRWLAISSMRAGDTFSITRRPPLRSNESIQVALCRRRSIARGETGKRPFSERNGFAGFEQMVTLNPSIFGASSWN